MARISRTKKERVLVLDSDSSVYAIGFATQKKYHYLLDSERNIKWEGDSKRELNAWQKKHDPDKLLEYDFTEEIDPVSYALSSAKKFVANNLAFAGCSRAIVFLTKGGNCFRHHRATIQKYKGNRDALTKPEHYGAVRDYYMAYYHARMDEKWEADDTCCMVMQKGIADPNIEYVMAAIDKDLLQQEGLHMNPNKKGEGVYVITQSEGWYNFYIQMLCGDTADHIKGLKGTRQNPGLGDTAAHELLGEAGTNVAMMCQIVYDQYVIRYGDKPFTYAPWWTDLDAYPDNEFVNTKSPFITGDAMSMFRENADLLYMLRTPDDQYAPHCDVLIDRWIPYPKGVVQAFLPNEVDDD